jgi:tryptophanyl-tRNA synthetase
LRITITNKECANVVRRFRQGKKRCQEIKRRILHVVRCFITAVSTAIDMWNSNFNPRKIKGRMTSLRK